jgi:capsular polysaccharide biosynthesis protein
MNREEISLDNYITAIWRAKWIVIIGTIAAAAVAYLIASRQPEMHRAIADLKVGRVWTEPLEDPYITERVINSPAFLDTVAAKLGVRPGQLRRAVQAETVVAGPRRSRYPLLVSITATAETDEKAMLYAKAAADEVKARHDQMFEEALKPRREQELGLLQRREEIAAQGAPSRELLVRIEDEISEVKANNTSATVTEKTALVTDVASGGTIRPAVWRNVAAAAAVAAIALMLAAALSTHLRAREKRAAAGNQS